jgi:hypothetical protein
MNDNKAAFDEKRFGLNLSIIVATPAETAAENGPEFPLCDRGIPWK